MLPLHGLPSSAGIRICGWYIFSPGGRLAKRVATSSQSLLNHALAKTCARILVASRVLTNWPMDHGKSGKALRDWRSKRMQLQTTMYSQRRSGLSHQPFKSAHLLVNYIRCSFKALGILCSFTVWHHHGSSWPSLCQDFSESSLTSPGTRLIIFEPRLPHLVRFITSV